MGAFFGATAPKNRAFRSKSSERAAPLRAAAPFFRAFRFNPLRA
jgi:hypothetical protein